MLNVLYFPFAVLFFLTLIEESQPCANLLTLLLKILLTSGVPFAWNVGNVARNAAQNVAHFKGERG